MVRSIPFGLFVTGTDTDVGKTQITAALARLLNERNVIVRPRKPVESGCRLDDADLIPADAITLQSAAKSDELLISIYPYRFESALSPELAAALVGVSLTLDEVCAACRQGVTETDFLLVEGAGGFYSPLASGVLNADLAVALSLPVLLVAADRLGTIGHTLLTVEAIKRRGLTLAGVVLNQVTPSVDPQMDNAAELSRWLGEPVMVTGHFETDSTTTELILVNSVLANLADRLAGGL